MSIFLQGYFIYLFIFAFYIELNPRLGNIWYRIGEDGLKHIQLQNLLYFILEPLQNLFLWHSEFLDLNYFIGGFCFSLILLVFKLK